MTEESEFYPFAKHIQKISETLRPFFYWNCSANITGFMVILTDLAPNDKLEEINEILTIAHELGHFFDLHEDAQKIIGSGTMLNDMSSALFSYKLFDSLSYINHMPFRDKLDNEAQARAINLMVLKVFNPIGTDTYRKLLLSGAPSKLKNGNV